MGTTFAVLIKPLLEYIEKNGEAIDKSSGSRTFKFQHFTLTMVFAYLMQVPSLRKLTDKLELSDVAKQLDLKAFAWTTIRDGFTRFSANFFIKMYRHVLQQTNIVRLDSIDELGMISLVDGSIFPTISNMCWAEYKKTKQAIRLHVEFSLNQMIPLEFIGQKANSSERHFLLKIVTKGVTYVADRGYFSFDVAAKISKAFAFFIIRIKDNMKFKVGKQLTVSGQIPNCLNQVSDQLIRFDNDPNQIVYRLVMFKVLDSEFKICTNRLDLSTLEIIMLYAYRWQIELLFKFIKRVLNGIHLFNHSQNGANIQFCLLMIMSVLYLNLRQFCKINGSCSKGNVKNQEISTFEQSSNINDFNTYSGNMPDIWINSINKAFESLWKISSYWIENLKEVITKPFDSQVINILARD